MIMTSIVLRFHFNRLFLKWYILRNRFQARLIKLGIFQKFQQYSPYVLHLQDSLRKKCSYSELFLYVFSLYSVRMRKNAGKMRTRITPNTDTFYAVIFSQIWKIRTKIFGCLFNISISRFIILKTTDNRNKTIVF